MEIKVGKVYEDGSGAKVRIVCTDYRPAQKEFSVLGLREDAAGETCRSYNPISGNASYGTGLVKEYIPKIKVRLIVYRTSINHIGQVAISEAEKGFVMDIPALFGTAHKAYTILTDQIIEVPSE